MADIKKIPPAIAKILQKSLSRIRRIVAFRGICATLAVFIASVLAIMAVDAMVTIYSSWVRWLLWCGALAATGAVAWFALIKPLRRKISLADVALLIERNHPELEERLSTVVELSEENREEGVWSKELVDEITKLAIRDAGKVSPRKEFTARTLKPRLIAAVAAVFILIGLFAAFPTATARLVARALVPSAEVDNIYASSLKVAPGDQVLLAGSPFKVSLSVDSGFPSKAFVRTSVNGRREAVERMVRVTEEDAKGPVFYEFDYPSVRESFTYRVNCGSALTRAYSVKVVPTPTFVNRRIRLEHPTYTGRPPLEYTNSAQVVGVAGSKVTISYAKPRDDIFGYVTIPGNRRVESAAAGENGLSFSFGIDKDTDGMWSAMAQDSNGFSNQVETATITVVKDTPPLVELTSPEESELKLPRSGILPVSFKAKDDFKVAKAVLEIAVGASDYSDLREIPIEKDPEGWTVGSDSILIQSLSAKLGKAGAFQVRVRVEDNLPAEFGGPGVTRSTSVLVELSGNGQNGRKSLAHQSLAKQVEATKKAAEDIRKILDNGRWNTESACSGYGKADNGWHLNEGKKCHAQAIAKTTNAEGLLADFIKDLEDTRLSTGAAILRPVLEKHIIPVHQELEDILLVDQMSRRPPCEKAVRDYKEVMRAYDDAIRKYGILTKTAEDMQKLEDLKERQEALSEAVEKGEMSAKDLAEAEKQLRDEMSNELRDDINRNLDQEMKRVDELAKKMDDLSEKQKEIKTKKSGDDQKNAEDQFTRELDQLSRDMKWLLQSVEGKTGTLEMDPDRTTEPLENSKWSVDDAYDNARDASAKLGQKDTEAAKSSMDDVNDSLKAAKDQLADAKKRLEKANERLSAASKEMQEMMDKFNEAMQAAMEAAKAELGKPMDWSDINKLAEQASQQSPLTPEQMKAMKDQMNAMRNNMSAEQMKAMMEQMKAQLGKLDPEAIKAQMQEVAQQLAQAKQQEMAQLPKSQEMQNAQQKMQNATDMLKQQMEQMMQQANMPQEQFQQNQQQSQQQQNQMQMPQMQQNQQNQQNQQQNQQQQDQQNQMQQSQSQQKQKSDRKDQKHATSNVRVDLEEDEGVDWFRMKSASGSGAEADPMNDVPKEYRGLVRDYFKALNEGGKK